MADQIGITGSARYQGIPNPTITWTGTGGVRTLTVFTSFDKTPMADRAQSEGNDGEVQTKRRRNKRYEVRFSAMPIGATKAAAQAIAADLPMVDDLCTIACALDAQAATPAGGCSTVEAVSARYTPENDLVVDFTVINWVGKAFVNLS